MLVFAHDFSQRLIKKRKTVICYKLTRNSQILPWTSPVGPFFIDWLIDWLIDCLVFHPTVTRLLNFSQCPFSGSALDFCPSLISTNIDAVNEVTAPGHWCHHHITTHECVCAYVCVLPDWPTWFLPHWPSYKYSYSHTILITVKGRVHIGGELYIIEKVIHLNTNLLISYWTRGVKRKFLEIEWCSSANSG